MILGRDAADNARLEAAKAAGEVLVAPVSVPGPTALVLSPNADDLALVRTLVCSYSRYDRFEGEVTVKVTGDSGREDFAVARPYDRDHSSCSLSRLTSALSRLISSISVAVFT